MSRNLLILAALCLLAVVSAQKHENGRPVFDRVMNFVRSNDRSVHVRLARADKSQASFMFTTEGFPRFRFQYADDMTMEQMVRFTYGMGLLRLVEFTESATGPAGFDPTDTVVRSYSLVGRSRTWSNVVVSDAMSSDGVAVKQVTTSHNFTNGMVTLRVYFAPTLANFRNATVGPNKAKFDVVLTNLTYAGVNSKYAVVSSVYSSTGLRGATNTTNKAMIGVGNVGVVSWLRTSDGYRNRDLTGAITKMPVLLNGPIADTTNYTDAGPIPDRLAAEVGSIVHFTFDSTTQPGSIMWDPETGFYDDALPIVTGDAASLLPSSFLLLALSVFAVFRLF